MILIPNVKTVHLAFTNLSHTRKIVNHVLRDGLLSFKGLMTLKIVLVRNFSTFLKKSNGTWYLDFGCLLCVLGSSAPSDHINLLFISPPTVLCQSFLKLYRSFCHGLKICMWFGYNPQIYPSFAE